MDPEKFEALRKHFGKRAPEIRGLGKYLGKRTLEGRVLTGSPEPAATGEGGAVQDTPRWKDGTPKDRIAALEERMDEERFQVDGEYQARADVQRDMAELVRLREDRRKATPPPLEEGDLGQADYEETREARIAAEKRGVLD